MGGGGVGGWGVGPPRDEWTVDKDWRAHKAQGIVHRWKSNLNLIKKDTKICDWDPYNAVIISEFDGKVSHGDPIKLVAQFDVPTLDLYSERIQIFICMRLKCSSLAIYF